MKINKKIKMITILIIINLLLLSGCKKNNEIILMFFKHPEYFYTLNDNENDILNKVEIQIKTKNQTILKKATDKEIEVTGLNLSNVGTYTMKFKYQNKELLWQYNVILPKWLGEIDVSWYNSETNVFKIDSSEKLAGVAKLVNEGTTFKDKTILLESDLNLNNIQWVPIGSRKIGESLESQYAFEGVFDGQGHTINNIKMVATHKKNGQHIESDESYYNFGLFGMIKNATIKNINLNTISIVNGMMNNGVRSNQGTGALIGRTTGSCEITNINILGNVRIDGEYKVGTIIGNATGEKTKISNIKINVDKDSRVFGNDKTYKDTNNFGGVIGFSSASELLIESVVTNIDVIGVTSGGIIGAISGNNCLIKNVVNYGKVMDSESNVCGGIVGSRFSNMKLENCYMLGIVSIDKNIKNDYADLIVGKYGKIPTIEINNVYYAVDRQNELILNSLNAIGKSYSELLELIPNDLKIK